MTLSVAARIETTLSKSSTTARSTGDTDTPSIDMVETTSLVRALNTIRRCYTWIWEGSDAVKFLSFYYPYLLILLSDVEVQTSATDIIQTVMDQIDTSPKRFTTFSQLKELLAELLSLLVEELYTTKPPSKDDEDSPENQKRRLHIENTLTNYVIFVTLLSGPTSSRGTIGRVILFTTLLATYSILFYIIPR